MTHECDALAFLERNGDTFTLTLALPDHGERRFTDDNPIELKARARAAASNYDASVSFVNDTGVSLTEWLCRNEIGGLYGLLGLYRGYVFAILFGIGIPVRLFVDVPHPAVTALGFAFLSATCLYFLYWPLFNELNDDYHVPPFQGESEVRKVTCRGTPDG